MDFDTVLDACKHPHRRIVLAALVETHQSVPVDDLANAIVTHNHHMPPTDVSGETPTRIRTALNHVHLPKLDEAGFIQYDSEHQLVKPTAQCNGGESHLLAVLDADPELAMPLETSPRSGDAFGLHHNQYTMTTRNPTRGDTHQRERDRAAKALTKALETDDVEETDYHIREAHQLLTLKTD